MKDGKLGNGMESHAYVFRRVGIRSAEVTVWIAATSIEDPKKLLASELPYKFAISRCIAYIHPTDICNAHVEKYYVRIVDAKWAGVPADIQLGKLEKEIGSRRNIFLDRSSLSLSGLWKMNTGTVA